MKQKKMIVVGIAFVLVLGLLGVGVRAYQKSKVRVQVDSVANLNIGYWEDEGQGSGTITNNDQQNVYLENGQAVSRVYVEDGQSVSVGDPLLAYDISSLEFSLQIKRLEIDSLKSKYEIAGDELEVLKHTKPYEPVEVPMIPNDPVLPNEEKKGEAYTYINEKAEAYDEDRADGSLANPYHYLCTRDAFVVGNFLNELKKNHQFVCFEVRQGNQVSGQLLASWLVSGDSFGDISDEGWYYILPHDENTTEEPPVQNDGYTASELAQAIREKKQEMMSLDLQRRQAELSLKELEEEVDDGIVYAKINGTVKITEDSSPYLQVVGSDGLFVRGSLSEMQLETIKVGQKLTVANWDNGKTYQAEITAIDEYPNENNFYYGNGNPNVSYYGFTASVEDGEGFRNGQYVQLTMNMENFNEVPALYISQGYVREENGQSYVLKDEDGKLVKQNVSIGKIVWGMYVEIKDGLFESDYIAFPYGKNVKEGAKTSYGFE